MKKTFIIINLILLFSCTHSSAINKFRGRGYWVETTSTYIDINRNIQWELDNIDNWRVAEEYRLPDTGLFCAAEDKFGICVMVTAISIEEGEKRNSIWNVSDEFIRGMIHSFEVQAPIFPGISYGEPIIQKVKYLFKDALRITLFTEVTDSRLLIEDSFPFAFQLYAFIKDDEVIVVTAMMPQYFLDNYGNEPFDDLLNRFSYIDATKEIH